MDGHSYAIKKGQGVSKMASAFKVYSKRGMGLLMSTEDLKIVNARRVGNSYKDDLSMDPLIESPGLRIINPTKAGD